MKFKKITKIINKIIFTCLLFFTSFNLISCNEEETTVPDEVVKIVASGCNFESVYQGYTYGKSSNVIITAYYTVSEAKDVTNSCYYPKISTSSAGTVSQKVTYTYKDKTVSTQYDVKVIDNSMSSIELDYSSCKRIYKLNEKIDLSNLKVYGIFPYGSKTSISNYTVSITDIYNLTFLTSTALYHDGVYDVRIKYNDLYKSYSIIVYDDTKTSYDYKADNSIDYIFNKEISFENNTELFKSPFVEISMVGENCNFSYNTFKYDDIKYDSYLYLTNDLSSEKSEGLKLSILKDCIVILTLKTYSNAISIRDANEEVVETIGCKDGTGYLAFEATPGNYTISSFENKSFIYNISFVFDNASIDKEYTDITISSYYVNKIYYKNDDFDLNSIEVYGVCNDENILLDKEDYSISLYYNGQLVDNFSDSGKYNLIISYKGNVLCNNRNVSFDITYKNDDNNLA